MFPSSVTAAQNDSEIENGPRHHGSMRKLILFNNIRVRLLELLCLLDIKTDAHSDLINDLCEFFRHRGQLELNHSKGFEKILHCFQSTNQDQTSLRNSKQLPFHGAYACWNLLLTETQSLSLDYATLSEIYNASVIFKLQNTLRIYKKYHELVNETHEEILRLLRNFYTTIRTYYVIQNEFSSSGTKLSTADDQRHCRKQKGPTNKKGSSAERQLRPNDNKLETLKTKSIYKHYIEASNASIQKCMLRDLKDIINSMDIAFSLMVSRAILAHATTDQKQHLMKLNEATEGKKDTDLNTEENKSSVLREGKKETYIQNILDFEFELQMQLLKLKEDYLRKNLEQVHEILDSVEVAYNEKMKAEVKSKTVPIKATSSKHKDDGKLYILANLSPVAKQLSFKHYTTQRAKLETKGHPHKHRPKLFGGSLEEYLKITSEQIPLIMRSCIRVINLFGLRSHGIFRVSGSQVEILNFRDCFERGEDPLASATDASDMNSVAGVLKLYLRELKEPLFPSKYFDKFISLIREMLNVSWNDVFMDFFSEMESTYEAVTGMRSFLKNISQPIVIVIRYLFSFLNHLSEYAEENMMDAFNLAVSFGPTLMPAPEDKKQLQYQTQLNELIKIIIIYSQEVFPKDLEGPHYEKCVSNET